VQLQLLSARNADCQHVRTGRGAMGLQRGTQVRKACGGRVCRSYSQSSAPQSNCDVRSPRRCRHRQTGRKFSKAISAKSQQLDLMLSPSKGSTPANASPVRGALRAHTAYVLANGLRWFGEVACIRFAAAEHGWHETEHQAARTVASRPHGALCLVRGVVTKRVPYAPKTCCGTPAVVSEAWEAALGELRASRAADGYIAARPRPGRWILPNKAIGRH
jgi:hypothetical protein